jgi:hypothetical protein
MYSRLLKLITSNLCTLSAFGSVDDALMALGQFIKTNAWVFQD